MGKYFSRETSWYSITLFTELSLTGPQCHTSSIACHISLLSHNHNHFVVVIKVGGCSNAELRILTRHLRSCKMVNWSKVEKSYFCYTSYFALLLVIIGSFLLLVFKVSNFKNIHLSPLHNSSHAQYALFTKHIFCYLAFIGMMSKASFLINIPLISYIT